MSRPLAAMVGRGRILGMQFHPEKSQSVGLGLVANFVRHYLGAPGIPAPEAPLTTAAVPPQETTG